MGDEAKPPCPKCDGREWIIKDDLNEDYCECLKGRLLKEHLKRLGPEILMAAPRRSPLFDDAKGIDRTEENLFLHGHWACLASHFRWALSSKFNLLMKKKSKHEVRIITDESLLDVYLGKNDYSRRPKSSREDTVTYNTLADYVGREHLLIVRLGFLGYPNKALPGVIKQALGIREVSSKPTWLIDSPTNPFAGQNSLAWSEDLQVYIDEYYDTVELDDEDVIPDPVRGPDVIPTSEEADVDSDEVAMGGTPAPPMVVASPPRRRPPPPPREEPDDAPPARVTGGDSLDLGGGKSKGKYHPGKFLKKKNSGGWEGP